LLGRRGKTALFGTGRRLEKPLALHDVGVVGLFFPFREFELLRNGDCFEEAIGLESAAAHLSTCKACP